MDVPKNSTILDKLKNILAKNPKILFAYLHGSVLSSEKPRDIDIAVYLHSEEFDKLIADSGLSLGFAIPLEFELEQYVRKRVDVQIINRAPLSFRYRVIKEGVLIVDKNSDKRCDFEYLSRVEYFDFSPRQKEYLQEAMA